ncbi:hypothetical protein [Psychrobacter sp. FDAARGOS_221]|uniref:hypothetical protein n=1 Tax=Psychrobacter sp. FDAARGOS_221 TaxID=1975705 RepID=UPI00187D5D26|nr:hypothetical protein [Psychrobacter sp. FDAARGOS_221]
MSNSDDKKRYPQQQPEAELTALKNQVDGNLGPNKNKDPKEAAEGLADNLEHSRTK